MKHIKNTRIIVNGLLMLIVLMISCDKKDSTPATPKPTIASFTPTSAPAGATVTITGTNFTGATAVSFGGTPATSFAVTNSTTITAVVGTGATGDISVVTPGGTATLTGFNFNNCSLSEANLLGSYKISSVKYKATASSTEVEYIDSLYDPCEKDDIITLNSDHTYAYTDAGTACAPNGSYNGDWSLAGNILTVDGDPATLESFSCTGFSGVTPDIFIAGDKVTFTYIKQ